MTIERIVKASNLFAQRNDKRPTHVLLSTNDYEQLKADYGNLAKIAGLTVVETETTSAVALVEPL